MTADKRNLNVYDTEASVATVREHFQPQVELLEELSAYGSNLLVRTFVDRDRKLEHVVALGCIFRQFLGNLDAVKVLVTAGAADACLIHLRAMLEELFYTKWLFKEDTATRARCFYVWNLRQNRSRARRCLHRYDGNWLHLCIRFERRCDRPYLNGNVGRLRRDSDFAEETGGDQRDQHATPVSRLAPLRPLCERWFPLRHGEHHVRGQTRRQRPSLT